MFFVLFFLLCDIIVGCDLFAFTFESAECFYILIEVMFCTSVYLGKNKQMREKINAHSP